MFLGRKCNTYDGAEGFSSMLFCFILMLNDVVIFKAMGLITYFWMLTITIFSMDRAKTLDKY